MSIIECINMKNKLHFWLITDAPPTPEGIALCFINNTNVPLMDHVRSHCTWKFVAEHLKTAERVEGTADIIIMDFSSLTLGLGCETNYYTLRQFLRKHESTIFHLVCYCLNDAKITCEEIKKVFEEENIVVDYGMNGNAAIAEYIINKTLEYFPYTEKK